MKKLLLLSSVLLLFAFLGFSLHTAASQKDLPRLYIAGDLTSMHDKTDIRRAAVQYNDHRNSFSGYAELKVQGTSSLWNEKQNYTIKFYQDADYCSRLKVNLGWGSESKYCLKANWFDKTHSRNLVSANLVSEINEYYGFHKLSPNHGAVDGYPIEVYLNDSFFGLYTLNIPKDEWLFGMDKSNPNHLIFFSESWEPSNMFHESATYDTWSLEAGEETPENLTRLNRVMDFVIHSSDEEFKEHFEEYLSLSAALNYYIFTDFACMADNIGKNIMLVSYDGELWYPSLYDMDLSWGENWTITELADYENSTIVLSGNLLWKRMEQNFGPELAARYEELRSRFLNKKHIMKLFRDFEASIPPEVFEMERSRWGDEIPGFDLSQIEHYLDTATPLLDQKYDNMKKE